MNATLHIYIYKYACRVYTYIHVQHTQILTCIDILPPGPPPLLESTHPATSARSRAGRCLSSSRTTLAEPDLQATSVIPTTNDKATEGGL